MPVSPFLSLPDRPVRLLCAGIYALLAAVSLLHHHYFLAGIWLWLVLGPLARRQPPAVRRWLHGMAAGAAVAALVLTIQPR